ncbi:DUF805 domain-containing protein [Gemmobacter serpentinus]|uniref:DUF805 domain-containing protein n=1 Tax=Gemmobacter serpentinus TaxID=2652247 RepID=UPI00124CB0ED|nr:DUF805 domain-containing protein [Gemmobacter serpentinus]
MNMVESVRTVFARSLQLSGRASRSEFWWFTLFSILAAILAGLVEYGIGLDWWIEMGSHPLSYIATGPLTLICVLALLIPSITVTVRRLHDRNVTGWVAIILLLQYLPMSDVTTAQSLGFIGIAAMALNLILLIYLIGRGSEGPNRYGPDPLAPPSQADIFA